MAANSYVQPIAADCWRGRGGKLSRFLGKNTIFNEHPVVKQVGFRRDDVKQKFGCDLQIDLGSGEEGYRDAFKIKCAAIRFVIGFPCMKRTYTYVDLRPFARIIPCQ